MEPLVSVALTTYNDAPYIKDALEGILKQMINFPAEVVIYDDASTDGTADILRDYEKKNADVFNVLYQSENQASKGVDIEKNFQLPRFKGKYIAVCDSRDYWFVNIKLDTQIKYMEADKSCVCTFHSMVMRDESDEGRVFGIDQVWFQGRNVYVDEFLSPSPFCFSKSSMVFRADALKNLPVFPNNKDFNAEILQHFLISQGYFHCLPDIMGVHRAFIPGSFEDKLSNDKEFAEKYHLSALNWLSRFNEYTRDEHAVLIGAKVQRHIEELNAMNVLMNYPKLVEAIIQTEDRIKNLEEIKAEADSSNNKKVQKKYKTAQKEYWSWYIRAIENGTK